MCLNFIILIYKVNFRNLINKKYIKDKERYATIILWKNIQIKHFMGSDRVKEKFVVAIRKGNYYELELVGLSNKDVLLVWELIVNQLNDGGVLGLQEEIVSKYPKIGPGGQLIAKRHTFKGYIEEAKEVNGEDITILLHLKGNQLEIEVTPSCFELLKELRVIETLVYESYQIQRIGLCKEPFIINSNILSDFKSGIKIKE